MMASILDSHRPAPRITEARYWRQLSTEGWFREIRTKRWDTDRKFSTNRLAEELALKATELRTADPDRVIREYRREHGLERTSAWKPRDQGNY